MGFPPRFISATRGKSQHWFIAFRCLLGFGITFFVFSLCNIRLFLLWPLFLCALSHHDTNFRAGTRDYCVVHSVHLLR